MQAFRHENIYTTLLTEGEMRLDTLPIGALKIPYDTGGPCKNYTKWPPQGQS